ncbi:helix-turn-helix domain-containing protein [uncultured Microbacterium sp.]|uniref:helix-turn-helix domain-containing protein n=1 Tax=uncultured Microbacterium sp. TaxID=191216 RepID=UPI0025F35F0D|nr:helix-turn-helix transcriptional regulator [uncultured Microbacterium sp.]
MTTPAETRTDRTPAEPERLWRSVVGETLRDARADRGETLAETARRAGVSPQYLSEMERGRKEASSEMLAAVSGALGLSLLDLTLGVAERIARGSARSLQDAATTRPGASVRATTRVPALYALAA